MSSGRLGLSVRFNQQQQREMMELLEFWGQRVGNDPKKIIRFAIDQLYASTNQIKKKLEKDALLEEQSLSESSQPSLDAETETPTAEELVNPS